MTTTAPETIPETKTGSGAGEYSHYAKREEIMQAMINGGLITALCGHQFPPTRDPKKFPVCPACKELVDMAEQLAH